MVTQKTWKCSVLNDLIFSKSNAGKAINPKLHFQISWAYIRNLTVFLLLFLLSSCGFKLRGIQETPQWLNHVALITEDGNKTLFGPLIRQLETNHITITELPSKANYLLILQHTTQTQQIFGVAASTNPRQYQLILSVDFILKTGKGDVVKGPIHLTIMRQLTVNNDRILGSDGESRLIREEMQRDLAIQILNRLSV